MLYCCIIVVMSQCYIAVMWRFNVVLLYYCCDVSVLYCSNVHFNFVLLYYCCDVSVLYCSNVSALYCSNVHFNVVVL